MKAVFLDRDGIINKKKENSYITSWDEFIFLPAVFKGLKLLCSSGYNLFIITNQQGIGKKIFTSDELEKIHKNMTNVLSGKGIKICGIYSCPHLESDNCDCRKPATGMIKRVIEEFPAINLKRSYLIGDSINDTEAGYRMGIKTILISASCGTTNIDHSNATARKSLKKNIKPDYIKRNLLEAAIFIINSK